MLINVKLKMPTNFNLVEHENSFITLGPENKSSNGVSHLSGTRAYRYKQGRDNLFYLEENEGFPRWMNVKEFPERPRAAVAFPYSNHNSYYMLIFGVSTITSISLQVNWLAIK